MLGLESFLALSVLFNALGFVENFTHFPSEGAFDVESFKNVISLSLARKRFSHNFFVKATVGQMFDTVDKAAASMN